MVEPIAGQAEVVCDDFGLAGIVGYGRDICEVTHVNFVVVEGLWLFAADLLVEVDLSQALLWLLGLEVEHISLHLILLIDYGLGSAKLLLEL